LVAGLLLYGDVCYADRAVIGNGTNRHSIGSRVVDQVGNLSKAVMLVTCCHGKSAPMPRAGASSRTRTRNLQLDVLAEDNLPLS
jgi:hypothetical protein